MVGALMIALLGTVLMSFAARRAHVRATTTGAPMGTFINLAILAGGFAAADVMVGTVALTWSLGQAVVVAILAVLLGFYLPQVLGATGTALSHAAHGAARGVGAGLESALSWAMPKILAVAGVVAVYLFVPQLFAVAVMIGGLYLIINGGFKKSAKKKRSH